MEIFKSLSERVFSLSPGQFDALALELFHLQYQHNPVYRDYVNHLTVNPEMVTKLTEIPFLPIQFFKNHAVKTGEWQATQVFESSGTTGQVTSRHEVYATDQYLQNCELIFETHYGPIENFTVLALLPAYLERSGSSLVLMAEHFISRSNDPRSGFFLYEHEPLMAQLEELKKEKRPVLLLGVTFALLDLAEKYSIDFPELIVMETGGMKGRRKEMTRQEVHAQLTQAFGVKTIHSEYGMTELFSQAYSKGWGIFQPSGSMCVMTRDVNDPLTISNELRSGALNIIDLANVHSCCFIETQDLGKVYPDGSFEVLGRMDNSDIRGCNLMVL